MTQQRPKETGSPPLPRFVEWLSTFRCDLRCTHCAAEGGEAGEEELGTTEAESLLRQLATLGTEHLCISGGEPTTRPDWRELLQLALGLFDKVHLISNGRRGAELLRTLEALPGVEGLTLALSIDGPRGVHDARRGAGSFSQVHEALATQSPVPREVITTVDRDNLDHVDAVAELCLVEGVRWWTLQPAVALGRQPLVRTLGPDAPRVVGNLITTLRARFGEAISISTSPTVERAQRESAAAGAVSGCPAAGEQIVIWPDGRITGCVLMTRPSAGSVREQPLVELWESAELAVSRRLCESGEGPCPKI